MGGVSLLLVDANSEGVRRTRMKMQGWWISTTTFDHTPRRTAIARSHARMRAARYGPRHSFVRVRAGRRTGCCAPLGFAEPWSDRPSAPPSRHLFFLPSSPV